MRSLAAIMRQADAPPGARIQAIAILLDRGWGRPAQPHTGEDEGHPPGAWEWRPQVLPPQLGRF